MDDTLELNKQEVKEIVEKTKDILKEEYDIEMEIISKLSWYDDWCVDVKVSPEIRAHEFEDILDTIANRLNDKLLAIVVYGGSDYTEDGSEILTGGHTLVILTKLGNK